MPYNNPHIKGWLRVILIIIAYLFVGGVFYLLGILVAGVDFQTPLNQRTDLQNLIISSFDFIGTLSVIFLFLKVIDNESFNEIGLKITKRTKDIIVGVFVGSVIMGFGLLSLMLFEEIVYENINFRFENLIYIFLLFIIISLKEEILMRGYVLRNFMYSFNKYIALILSSFLFSILHGLNPDFSLFSFINLFLAGILLGISYTFTKNLGFPIALHFSWNFFQSLFGFNVSGLDSYSLIEFNIPEPNLINGGEFGFEGSILSVIVQVILITSIYFYYNHKTEGKKDKLKNS
ncbi:MAG: CPBP family intramembrane metalloprotease [Bacteroidetes bacterium]|jgi:membrane protease YdiL (CAAX protease family)|nr:CPBP family intramembrane metalloprotease [Bacteroidota bacterium]